MDAAAPSADIALRSLPCNDATATASATVAFSSTTARMSSSPSVDATAHCTLARTLAAASPLGSPSGRSN